MQLLNTTYNICYVKNRQIPSTATVGKYHVYKHICHTGNSCLIDIEYGSTPRILR